MKIFILALALASFGLMGCVSVHHDDPHHDGYDHHDDHFDHHDDHPDHWDH
jgi:hypothetical protein